MIQLYSAFVRVIPLLTYAPYLPASISGSGSPLLMYVGGRYFGTKAPSLGEPVGALATVPILSSLLSIQIDPFSIDSGYGRDHLCGRGEPAHIELNPACKETRKLSMHEGEPDHKRDPFACPCRTIK